MVFPIAANDLTRNAVLIANPAAGRGRGARALPAARAAFASSGARIVVTERAGDERRIARAAIADGATAIAALGGDGTWSNVAAAILEAGSTCALLPLDAGTGSDWVKTLDVPAHDFAAMAARLADRRFRSVDAGVVEDGASPPTFFINVASFGVAAAATAVAARTRWLRGDALYSWAALSQLFRFTGFSAGTEIESGATPAGRRELLVATAIGRHFGGKFTIAPAASVDDGLLDVVRIGDAGAMRRAKLFAMAGRGAHVDAPEVEVLRERWVRLAFSAPPTFEADGELHRAGSATVIVRCLPGVLRVTAR